MKIMEYLIFNINNDSFAILMTDVNEVLMMCTLYNIPGSPPFLVGVLNLRGKLFPVVDLTQRLGFQRHMAKSQNEKKLVPLYAKNTKILLTTTNNMTIGMIIDGFSNLKDIDNNLERKSVVNEKAIPTYIDGMVIIEAKIIQIVKIKNVMSQEELALLQQIET